MILTELKKYLMARKILTLQDLALHFKMEPETLKPMLDKWLHKGKVRCHDNNLGCAKGCCKCDPATIVTYEWIG